MAAFRITCPSCKTALQVGEQTLGKAVRCPKCQTVLKVPATAPAPPAPVPRPTAPSAAVAPRRMAARPAAETRASPALTPPRDAIAPRPGLARPPASPVPPLLPDAASRGRSILPGLAVGALVILLAGGGMVVGLFLLTRMIPRGQPVRVADADQNGPAGPSANPTGGDTNTSNAPSEGVKLAADYLADGFTGVVVLRPKRMLGSDALADLPQEQWFGALAALSLDPRDAQEAVFVLDPAPAGEAPFPAAWSPASARK